MHRKGVYAGHKYDDAAWEGLTHEQAVREAGRQYRPASRCNRPQTIEREVGKPNAPQMDLFATAQGRTAIRLCRSARDRKKSSQAETLDPDRARLLAARFMAWRADRGE